MIGMAGEGGRSPQHTELSVPFDTPSLAHASSARANAGFLFGSKEHERNPDNYKTPINLTD